ncbi:PREDICTED: merozoite surface protein CMZ-8 [Pygoscelis adeliae]|uniref:merozoite surface protein CMZ-8 n=1 Tax=Pygoscelis adeliae TaxID=9238 RepID=UPI0004F4DB5A|nr:PREDICTED: merozoite surface protein CMZ-8 [Pygoscelis adeliae]
MHALQVSSAGTNVAAVSSPSYGCSGVSPVASPRKTEGPPGAFAVVQTLVLATSSPAGLLFQQPGKAIIGKATQPPKAPPRCLPDTPHTPPRTPLTPPQTPRSPLTNPLTQTPRPTSRPPR